MATTVNLRKLLHRKAWETITPMPSSTNAGSFVAAYKNSLGTNGNDFVYYVNGVSGIYNYNSDNDGWMQVPNSGIAGSYTSGACGESVPMGMLGGAATNTATAGTTTTITTNRTIVKNISGVAIRVVAGTGIGYSGTVSAVVLGANSVLTVTPANGVAFDATTQFQVFSGSLWFFNSGTSAVGFSVYDRATNAWTAKSVTNLPTSFGTDGQLVSTPSDEAFLSGTATAGAASTLTSNLDLILNGWSNYQIRITGGTGIGQIRTIASNTAGPNSVFTVSAAWTVVPDATSTYAVEGNDDFLYLLGNNAVALYKYVISTNTWSTLSPTAARSGSSGAGGTCDWINSVPTWTNTTTKTFHYTTLLYKQNGRYLYAFRGAAVSTLDAYDIAANTWISGIAYGNQMETFTTGSCSVDMNGKIYIQKDATGRIFRFDIDKNKIDPWGTNVQPQSTTVTGDKMFFQTYQDGATKINFLYTTCHSRGDAFRIMEIG